MQCATVLHIKYQHPQSGTMHPLVFAPLNSENFSKLGYSVNQTLHVGSQPQL